MHQTHPCRLLDSKGTLVTAARCSIASAAGEWKAVVSTFDRPGQVVKRCLLGQLRNVLVQFEDGVTLGAEVERVYFDPKQGRTCTVRLSTAMPNALKLPSFLSGLTAAASRDETERLAVA